MNTIKRFSTMLVEEQEFEYKTARIESPAEVAHFIAEKLRIQDRPMEQLWALMYNAKLDLIGLVLVSQGGISGAEAQGRDVFREAIIMNAFAIVLTHNHPSGDPTPSEADIKVTQAIEESGKLLGIKLLDHIVMGRSGFFSFTEHGLL